MENENASATHAQKHGKTASPAYRGRHWKGWYFVGIASVGLTVGFFAGNSDSPVVSTLLPLLFALIAGGGGLYLFQQDLEDPRVPERVRILGIAMFAFCGCALLAGAAGIAIRTGVGLDRLLPRSMQSTTNSQDLIGNNDPEVALRLLMLRGKLEALGVTNMGKTTVMGAVVRRPDDATLRRHLESLAAECKAALDDVPQKEVKSKSKPKSDEEEQEEEEEANDLDQIARDRYSGFYYAARAVLSEWTSVSSPIPILLLHRDLESLIQQTDTIQDSILQGGPFRQASTYEIRNFGKLEAPWQKVRIGLLQLDESLGLFWTPNRDRGGLDIDDDLDATIKLLRSRMQDDEDKGQPIGDVKPHTVIVDHKERKFSMKR